MSILLDRKDDGSLAFFLDGDLQFDSRDEHIYHECLALPALALAEKRNAAEIKALVIGGGDGLSARELLKSSRVAQLDLVDYDNKVLDLARSEFASFNNNSLADIRTRVHVEDAREFIKRAQLAGSKYDVIISDFTAPQDAEGAQLHAIEFYSSLVPLLGENGVLAANTVSPSGTPEAFWSIYNSMLASKLNPRPYRIVLPSFAEQDYGVDWGFIMASPSAIVASEIESGLTLAEPRKALLDQSYLRKLFFFPQEVLQRQATSSPGAGSSDILVHYLFNPKSIDSEEGVVEDALLINLANLSAPEPVRKSYLLPLEARTSLSKSNLTAEDKEAFIENVLKMVPAVRRFQSREMIAAFLKGSNCLFSSH